MENDGESGAGAAAQAKRPYRMQERQRAVDQNREHILKAAFELFVSHHYDEVSLDSVATSAGVSRQTVHRQFGSKEHLMAAVIDWRRPQEEAADLRVEAGDVEGAIRQLVDRYETTGDAIVRFLALEGRIEPIDDLLGHGRRAHRAWIERIFDPDLPEDTKAREDAVLALYAATDVMVWKLLRRDFRRSRTATEAGMTRLVHGVLRGIVAADPEGSP